MKLRTLFLIFLSLWLIAACTNSDLQPKQTFSKTIQLAKGNYWVYQAKVKNLSSHDIIESNDSTFIRTDSVINGNRYYRMENIFGLSVWKRDSLGYIVDSNGEIEFSASNTTDVLYQSTEGAIGLMGGKVEQVTVPAGTFPTIFFYVLEKIPVGGVPPSKNDPSFFNDEYTLHGKTWYANGIGVVKSEFYYGGTTFQRSLIRSNLNK